MSKDVVIRISKENHKRLKDLMEDMADHGEKRPTVNILMEQLLDSMEKVRGGELIYIVDEMSFTDVALARGEAIVRAVARKEVPTWPKVAVVLGHDHG